MKQRVVAAALTMALAMGAVAPAMADGAASTRNIILVGIAAAAAVIIPNYRKKREEKKKEEEEITRRQAAYRDWFYNKYGYYPTDDQFRQWYVQTYGRNPE